MSVGLPGSGIGGIFYLLSALWMPCAGAWRAVRRQPVRLGMVARQTSLALGMIAALFATGWAIEQLIVMSAWNPFGPKGTLAGTTALPHILRATTFAWSFGTLGSVLLTVQILRLFFARKAAPAVAMKPQVLPVRKQKVA